jgi:hypothetical protein
LNRILRLLEEEELAAFRRGQLYDQEDKHYCYRSFSSDPQTGRGGKGYNKFQRAVDWGDSATARYKEFLVN